MRQSNSNQPSYLARCMTGKARCTCSDASLSSFTNGNNQRPPADVRQ